MKRAILSFLAVLALKAVAAPGVGAAAFGPIVSGQNSSIAANRAAEESRMRRQADNERRAALVKSWEQQPARPIAGAPVPLRQAPAPIPVHHEEEGAELPPGPQRESLFGYYATSGRLMACIREEDRVARRIALVRPNWCPRQTEAVAVSDLYYGRKVATSVEIGYLMQVSSDRFYQTFTVVYQ